MSADNEPNASVMPPNASMPPANASMMPPNASMPPANVSTGPASAAAAPAALFSAVPTPVLQCPRRVAPNLRIAQVTCEQKHTLAGLFVLFRPQPSTTLQKIKNLKKQVGMRLDPPFQLGMVGRLGFLSPPEIDQQDLLAYLSGLENTSRLPGDPDPVACALDLMPDSHRLLPGQKYEFYFIHHPDPAYALKVYDEINEGSSAYGEPFVKEVDADGIVRVPEDPSHFLPQGSEFYGHWTLYRSMPCAECEPVKQQVRRLQLHLGALRYIVGTGIWPYLPDFNTDNDRSGGSNDGIIDVRVMNAILRFQQDACSGKKPFKPKDKPHSALVQAESNFGPAPGADFAKRRPPNSEYLQPENSWKYLEGSEQPAPSIKPLQADGVVDSSTAEALKHWLSEGLRKPGDILVSIANKVGGVLWMRPEAASAIHAWIRLVQALGFDEGLGIFHTYRSILVDIVKAKKGRSAVSIHKTGLAVDLASAGFLRAVKSWPVAYVREQEGSRILWRLYGAMTLPLPSTHTPEGRAAASEFTARLKPRLLALKSAKELEHPLVRLDPEKLLVKAVDKLLAELEEPKNAVAFIDRYYKFEIPLWDYDKYHPEGGYPRKLLGADGSPKELATAEEFYRDHLTYYHQLDIANVRQAQQELTLKPPKNEAAAAKMAKAHENLEREATQHQEEIDKLHGPDSAARSRSAFVDLTGVGELVHMKRIGAWKSGWQLSSAKLAASQLKEIAAHLADVQQWGGYNATLEPAFLLRKEGKTARSLSVPARRLDGPLMLQWHEVLQALKKELPRSVKVNSPQCSVTVTWGNGKLAEEAPKLAGLLRGSFSEKQFYSVLPMEGVPRVQTGADWAAYLDKLPGELEQQALVVQAQQDEEAKKDPKKAKKIGSARPKLQQRLLTLQPVFDLAFQAPESGELKDALTLLPGDVVELPAPGEPICMEWWHFQRTDQISHRLWGDLLEDIGWTRECLGDTPSSQLYLRPGIGYPVGHLNGDAH
jgi:hypothetical protein